MNRTQVIDSLNNTTLSTFVTIVPILFMFWATATIVVIADHSKGISYLKVLAVVLIIFASVIMLSGGKRSTS